MVECDRRVAIPLRVSRKLRQSVIMSTQQRRSYEQGSEIHASYARWRSRDHYLALPGNSIGRPGSLWTLGNTLASCFNKVKIFGCEEVNIPSFNSRDPKTPGGDIPPFDTANVEDTRKCSVLDHRSKAIRRESFAMTCIRGRPKVDLTCGCWKRGTPEK